MVVGAAPSVDPELTSRGRSFSAVERSVKLKGKAIVHELQLL
jgi:hypothetical protein